MHFGFKVEKIIIAQTWPYKLLRALGLWLEVSRVLKHGSMAVCEKYSNATRIAILVGSRPFY